MLRSTFFDETEEPELGEKHKTRSRRSSLRKTITLFTESRRSLELGSSPMSPTSPKHRRSFSFNRRASSSATSVVEPPQSPSQYYNDPEARMKLKMVVASPESFDQALEHGFPSTTKLDAIGGSNETAQIPSRGRANTTGSPPRVVRQEAKSCTFFDASSVSSDDEDDDNDDHYVQVFKASRRSPEQRRQFEFHSYPTDHNLDSDVDDYNDDDDSVSDNNSPVTPQWADGTSRIASPVRPELYLDHESHGPYIAGQLADHQGWDNGHYTAGPREMTLRMTLTKPELRSPEEQLRGWHATSTQKSPLQPYLEDQGGSGLKNQQNRKPSGSQPKLIEKQSKPSKSDVKKSKSPSTKPSPDSKQSKQSKHPKQPEAQAKTPKYGAKTSKSDSKKAPHDSTPRQEFSTPSTGKVRGLWRKVKDRKG